MIAAPPPARNVYTIPAGAPFLDTLAQGLLDEAGQEPLALARQTILLPTRRACRALREAFLRLSDGRPLLLPRMLPLGEVDEDELALGEGEAAGPVLELPPAVPDLHRQLLLARLIMAMGGGRGGASPTLEQAARLAAELARLLDQVQTEGLSFDRLATLVPADYAAHWQITLDFLGILTEHWPAILGQQGFIDPAARRNLLLRAQAEAWRAHPPAQPVIAAGSTGSIPATADLLTVVAGLPNGRLVLPGLDQDLDEDSWEAIEPTHPQFGVKQLLARLDVGRRAVRPWPVGGDGSGPRRMLAREIMRPSATTDVWRALAAAEGAAMVDGLTRLDCPGPREEAGAIALMMREVLETEGRTAALVTPDRGLARRVAAELGRWGIVIDDSAGRPLSLCPPGVFLRLTAAMVAEEFAPHATLAALKHPLAAGGLSAGRFRARVRSLERKALRGPRPAAGLGGLRQAVGDERLASWLAGMEAAAEPFTRLMARASAPLADLLRAHVAFAEWLAADDQWQGASRLWKGDAGEAAALFVGELADSAGVLDAVTPTQYPGLLDDLMAARVVRPAWGGHPRLHIWGPLEARMQSADRLILGGLNEGTWPAEAAADPWMSRPMREAFGLPLPERRIGLSAHDFAQALCAPEVVLTRAVRVDGTPTVPSRWLLRMDAVLKAVGVERGRWRRDWLDWFAALDRPARIAPLPPPAPRPPVDARPRHLWATQVETWMRDPYAIYARHVLRLKALDPIDADPGAAEYGEIVHQALENFCRAYPEALPSDPLDRLLEIGRETFGEKLATPGVWAFWWPRFERVARWFVAQETRRRPTVASVASEVSGSIDIDAPGGPFRISAKADRIDRLRDGGLVVIDYKTGAPPSAKEVAAGFAPQLPIEAAIVRAGGFPDVPPGPLAALCYWRLSGNAAGGEERSAGDDPEGLADQALAGLARLVAAFDDPETPYEARPHPDRAPRFSDYQHLARVKEWAVGGEEGE